MAESVADRITTQCAACGARFQAPAQAIGRKVKCRKCGEAFVVEAHAPDQPAAEHAAAAEHVAFACNDCGKQMKAPANAAGKRVRCRHCQAPTTIPDPDAGNAAPEDDVYTFAESPDLLAGLAGGEAVDEGEPCPACKKPTRPGSAICLSCGHQLIAAGRVHADADTAGAPTTRQARPAAAGGLGLGMNFRDKSAASAGGRLILGTLVACVGAAVGAALWVGAGYIFMGFELVELAPVVGFLVGGGMALGSRGTYFTGGLLSGAVCIAGIIAAKLALAGVLVADEQAFEAAISLDRGRDARGMYIDRRMEVETVQIEKRGINAWSDKEGYREEMTAARQRVAQEADQRSEVELLRFVFQRLEQERLTEEYQNEVEQQPVMGMSRQNQLMMEAEDRAIRDAEALAQTATVSHMRTTIDEKRRELLIDQIVEHELGSNPNASYDQVAANATSRVAQMSIDDVAAEEQRLFNIEQGVEAAVATGFVFLGLSFPSVYGFLVLAIAVAVAFTVGWSGAEWIPSIS